MKPLIVRIAPKLFSTPQPEKRTRRPTGGIYELNDSGTWRGAGSQTMTQVDASGSFGGKLAKEGEMNRATDIMMTRETEVKWQDNPSLTWQTSAESLV